MKFTFQATSALIFLNTENVFDKSSSNNKNLDSFTKKCHEYCTLTFNKCPTRVTWNSYSIFDHVLISFPDRVSTSGAISVGISDHQLIYCTRQTATVKSYCHKQIIFRALINYSPVVYEETLRKLNVPQTMNYFTTLTKLMNTSFKRLRQLLIILHPVKTNSFKSTLHDWFDVEIM